MEMYKCKVFCLVNSLLIGSFRLRIPLKSPFFVGWEGGGRLIMSPVLQIKECNNVRGHVELGFYTFTASIIRQNLWVIHAVNMWQLCVTPFEKAFHF